MNKIFLFCVSILEKIVNKIETLPQAKSEEVVAKIARFRKTAGELKKI